MMYKLLIVDDEEIEREGMAEFISWSKYEIKLIGTAWNGVEGLEKIQAEKPDIVITDIKMPIMDGITLLKKTKEIYPDIEFIVLSGYGEYEYTSQAMAEGVRHYILKPCDEDKIALILNKVKKEIDEKRKKNKKEKRYQSTIYRLLPRAKEQVFRNMLLGREQLVNDYQMFLEEIGDKKPEVLVLAIHSEKNIDYLEQFIIGNVAGELLGEKSILLSTSIEQNVLFLVDTKVRNSIEAVIKRTIQELEKTQIKHIQAAISENGKLEEVNLLYEQVMELLRIGNAEGRNGLLHYGLFREKLDTAYAFVDYRRLKESHDYVEILFEVFLTFVKMALKNYTIEQMQEICDWTFKVLYQEDKTPEYEKGQEEVWSLLKNTVERIAQKQNIGFDEGKEAQRVKAILLEVFRHIRNQELSIQFLSREVLFMNEDYFGRIFSKNMKEKFSTFLLRQRIKLAKRVLQYEPDIKISQLAELVGYASDGQYFSKAFRKITGMSPIEYKDMLKK